MRYVYNLVGLRIIYDIPFELTIKEESREFISEYDGSPADIYFTFTKTDKLTMPEDGNWVEECFYSESDTERYVYHCTEKGGEPYACVIWQRNFLKTVVCKFLPCAEKYMNFSNNICSMISAETFMITNSALLLHSSLIIHEGRSVLFSAPSGTGKSTQAELWSKYENAEIINGDRAGLRKTNGEWAAYGLPYAGSSGIYRNESAPIAGIVVLRQAKENEIIRLRPAEAVKYLYSELTLHSWDKNFVDKVLDLLADLLKSVPVLLLRCRPDEESVKMAKNMIFKEISTND